MIRLGVLDDHPAVLAGLRRLLEHAPDIEVLASAEDEVALARELRGRRIDVLVVDYDPHRGDALALCRRVKARPEGPRVLIYTAYTSPSLAIAAREARADGVLDKSAPAAEVLETIRRVANGETLIATPAREYFGELSLR